MRRNMRAKLEESSKPTARETSVIRRSVPCRSSLACLKRTPSTSDRYDVPHSDSLLLMVVTEVSMSDAASRAGG